LITALPRTRASRTGSEVVPDRAGRRRSRIGPRMLATLAMWPGGKHGLCGLRRAGDAGQGQNLLPVHRHVDRVRER
jgi:hypothetical protein